MTCKWDEFTGIECTKEGNLRLYDSKRDITIPVCQQHFNEFIEDQKKRNK